MRKVILVLCIAAGLSSCYNRKASDLYPVATTTCDTTTSTYSGTVLPIMRQHCAITGCHTGSSPANGLAYDKYAGIAVVAQNGQLIQAIEHSGSVVPMPLNLPMLDQCSIDKIVRWVNLGYQNN